MALIHVLSLGEPKPLFTNQELSNLVDARIREAIQAVQQIPADALLNTPTEDIVQSLTDKHSFTAPVLKRDQAYIDGPHEIEIQRMDFDREIRLHGTLVALIVPFDGEGGMFYMNPNRWGHVLRANLHHNNLVLTVRGENLQPENVNKTLENQLKEVEEFLGWQKGMADSHRQTLPARLRPSIEERKKKLLADRNMVAGLAFPIRARPDAPKTYVAPVVRKKLQVIQPATTAPFAPEPMLEEATYKSILDIIQSMTLVMERSPTAFSKMGEEDLRQHYLVQLNGQFEGAATGETFNYQGKTDILIREKDRNIFIAECKFWRGEKSFSDTIDQMLSYLSWRDTKTAIVLFNRNKGLSDVLTKVQATAKAHPHFKRGPTVEGDTRFRFIFGNPSDHNREVILTALVFDVPA
jgi:hypothetical protein